MGSSIQEYLKKINSRLSFVDCLSLAITAICIALFACFLVLKEKRESLPVTYISGGKQEETQDIRPFASKNGITYTFSWCQGAGMIKPSNRVYFSNEEEAKRTGRVLSKFCLR
jgi:hypothetical protein